MTVMNRREVLIKAGAAALGGMLISKSDWIARGAQKVVKKGRLKQSVARWCYNKIPMPDFCRAVADMGLPAIDLLQEKEWEFVRQYGLICSMGYMGEGTIPKGLNYKENHDPIVKAFERTAPLAAKQGVPNLITFFGNRRGVPKPGSRIGDRPEMSDAQAIENCVIGLNRMKKVAEDHGVTICVELLNSKVDHKDYQGDHTAFGLQVVKAVASPRVKLLYDIYHMQIMDGDIIRTIRDNLEHIDHFHTGGVPGRHELDATQELQWATVCKAIADAGFKGYVAHEFIPTRDPIASLREAIALCDV